MIGIVADDVTGANDIGSMFAKADYHTDVYFMDENSPSGLKPPVESDVIIFDTDSRFDDSEIAYQKVFHATKQLQELGATRFFNKTCSVFRGNIGAEFDAMLDALEQDFALIILGFPKNGRLTKHGHHYVHEKKLEESEFRNDPMHPMTESNLASILQKQTNRKVGLISFELVQKGPERLQQEIEKMKATYQYVILDVTSQRDLQIIAETVKNESILCGSSAVGEELPKYLGTGKKREKPTSFSTNGKGTLCVAGSLMPQTKMQIKHMKEKGEFVYELHTTTLFHETERSKEMKRIIENGTKMINIGRHVIIHTSNESRTVQTTKEIGQQLGYSSKQTSKYISGLMANIAQTILQNTDQNKLLVAGGDTSAAVCKKMNINRMSVWKEIQPGLPSCITYTTPPLLLVLKSGSFGQPDFFVKAIDHMSHE